jgi:hypothetical protein
MRNTSGCLSSNIEEKELKDKPNDFNIPVDRLKKKSLCLKCGKKFLSKGCYNRICVKCGLINESIRADIYSVSLRSSDVMNCVEEHYMSLIKLL